MKMREKHEACQIRTESHLYRIGMFAQMNHITVKTLRFYEEQGLLAPAYVDEKNGYRYYTLDQSASLHAPVLIKTLPACKIAACEKTIDTYDALFDIMPEMGAEMEQLGCECALPEYCFTQYLEPGFKEENIRIQTCEAVTRLLEDTATLKFYELEEVTAACIYHRGSYADFSRTYTILLNYIEENGYEIAGNIRESYIDGVWNKDTEEDWLSEIQIPVRKKS